MKLLTISSDIFNTLLTAAINATELLDRSGDPVLIAASTALSTASGHAAIAVNNTTHDQNHADLAPESPSVELPSIVIYTEGGVIQCVETDHLCDVLTIDYDAEDNEPEDITDVDQDDGSVEDGIVSCFVAHLDANCRARIRKFKETAGDAC